MRELKFRVWWKGGSESTIYTEYDLFDDTWTDKEYIAIEQYTGLKDKNGKEIYDGDIIDFFGEKYPVIYRAGGFWVEYSKAQKDHLFLYAVDSEVIGNIHENPELLGVKE